MTYYEDDSVVLDVRMRMEGDKIDDNSKGDYVNLRDEDGAGERCNHFGCCWGLGGSVFWYWVKLAVTFTFFGLLAAACVEWVGPFLMDRVSFDQEVYAILVLIVFSVVSAHSFVFSVMGFWWIGICLP